MAPRLGYNGGVGDTAANSIRGMAMEIPVFVEPVAGNGYRAETCGLSADGATREEALSSLNRLLQERVKAGAQIVPLQVPWPEPPWAEFRGFLRGDPMFEAWKQAMADYRRQMDEDPDVP